MKRKVKTWEEYIDILWHNLNGHPGNTVLYAKSGNPQDARDEKIYYVFSSGKYFETSEVNDYWHSLEEKGLTLERDYDNDDLGYDAPYPYEYESFDDFLKLPTDKDVNIRIYDGILNSSSGLTITKPSLSASFISAAKYLEVFKKDEHPELNVQEHNTDLFDLAIKIYCEKCNYPKDSIADFSDDVCRKFFEQTLGILCIWISLLPELNLYQKKFLQLLDFHDNRIYLGKMFEPIYYNFPIWAKSLLEDIENENEQDFYNTLDTINKCNPDVLTWDRHQLLTLTNVNWAQIKEWEDKCKKLQERNDFLSKQNEELTKLIQEHIEIVNTEFIPQIIEEYKSSNNKSSNKNIIFKEAINDDLEEQEAPAKNENERYNQEDIHKKIPQEYYNIIRNVINPHIKVGDKLLPTAVQMKKAAENITLEKPCVIALFLVVCKEVGAVKSHVGVTDFVRTLIGLELKKYIDENDNKNVINGVSSKINGGKGKTPLPSKHEKWENSNDRKIGNDIYEKLTTE